MEMESPMMRMRGSEPDSLKLALLDMKRDEINRGSRKGNIDRKLKTVDRTDKRVGRFSSLFP